MLEERIRHNFPVRHFVMSASHNKTGKKQNEVDEEIIRKAESYRKSGAKCISYKFQRVKEAPIDELKFLMPIYKDIPVLAFQITYAVMQGIKVSVVGSNEVGLVVDALREYLPIPKENLIFVHEGEKLSLGNSIIRGAKALKMNENDFFYFVPLDMPFFYNYVPLLYDKDIIHNVIVADCNARERAFKGYPEIFPRNYYWIMKDGKGRCNIKEPAVFGFSAGMDFLKMSSAADEAYKRRQSGAFGPVQAVIITAKNIVKHPLTFMKKVELTDLIDISTALAQKTFMKKMSFYSKTAEHFGYFINMAPIRWKAEHNDPFRVKDIDAWHDLWYYALVIQKNQGLEGIIPYAREIEGFDEVMKEIKSDIGVLRDFPAYANQRAKDLRMEWLPFRNRELVAKPAKGEDLEGSIAVLHKQMEIFESNRHLHLADYSRTSKPKHL